MAEDECALVTPFVTRCCRALPPAPAPAPVAESIVLLNNSAPTEALRLPWPAAPAVRSVAVIGAYAKLALSGGKPDYQAANYSTLYDGVVSRYPGAAVSFTPGYGGPDAAAAAAAAPIAIARVVAASDITIVVVGIKGVGNGPYDEHEAHDRTEIGLPPDQLAVVQAAVAAARGVVGGGGGGAAGKRIAVVLVNGGPLSCDWCRDHVDTVRGAHRPRPLSI